MRTRPPAWRRYLRFFGSNVAGDVDDELRFHMEMRIKEYIARGLSPDDARRLAEQRFGDPGRARDACVDIQTEHARVQSRVQLGAAIRQDVVYASRVLRRQFLPSIVAAACIAIGIGATTSMFTVTNAMLFRPLPYPNGGRIVTIGTSRNGNRSPGQSVSSMADFADWRARQHSFTQLAVIAQSSLTVVIDEPVITGGAGVTTNFFDLLGVSAEYGRLFHDGDDAPNAAAIAIVSHRFADRYLGGTANVVGRDVRISGAQRTIVGVLSDQWTYPTTADVFLPQRVDPLREGRGNRHLEVMAELRPGVSVEQADRDMRTIGLQLERENPDGDGGISPFVLPLRERWVGSARSSLLALAAATILILVVACTNVAALQLARASTRAREIAVRVAIGAGRRRIIAQLLVESMLLGLVGGGIGVGLAFVSRSLIVRAVASNMPRWMTFDLDARALAFAAGVSVMSAILFGIAPALRLTRRDSALALHGGSATPDAGGTRLQRAFVVVELALSVVLVIGAALAIESVVRLRDVPLGFQPAGLMTFRISLQGKRFDDDAERARVVSALAANVSAIPEVESAAATTYAPVASCCSMFGTTIEGRDAPANEHLMVTGNIVTPGLFHTMGIPLRAGRDFGSQDDATAPRVVVINETFAKRFWPAGDAIGHRVDTGHGMATIIGIVGDIKQGRLIDAAEPQFYRPFAQDPWSSTGIMVRMRNGDSTRIAAEIRRVARDLDPVALPIGRITTMQHVLDDAVSSNRVLSQLLAAFAVVALVLAAIGTYAIMSFFVSRRSRELGLRIALGARPSAVFGLVLRQTGAMAFTGGAAGLLAGAEAARALAHTMYGVSAAEPLLYVAAAGSLALAAFVASIAPARRASAVDPLVALRAD